MTDGAIPGFCEHDRPLGLGESRPKEYRAVAVYADNGQPVGFIVVCSCTQGDHFLRPSAPGRGGGAPIVEGRVSAETPLYRFYSIYDAMRAIGQWTTEQQAGASPGD